MSTTQGIDMRTTGVHHISLRCTDVERARRFYVETLGFPIVIEREGAFLFRAGGTIFGVRAPGEGTPANDRFDPFRVGLDHIALGCEDEAELERVATALTEAGVENTGVKTEQLFGKRYVAFKDPDRIAWEFYMV